MAENLDEPGHRRRFRKMSTIELTHAWEEPMADPIRALLLAELVVRSIHVRQENKFPTVVMA